MLGTKLFKYSLTFFAVLFLVKLPSQAQSYLQDTMVVQDRVEQRKIKKSNFSGVLLTKLRDGYNLEELENGVNHGLAVYSGKDWVQRGSFYYKKRHGTWTDRTKGKLTSKTTYEYGTFLSQHTWDTLGQIILKNDLKTTGHFSKYYPNGQVMMNTEPLDKQKTKTEIFTRNGVLLQTIIGKDTTTYSLQITADNQILKGKSGSLKKKRAIKKFTGLESQWGKGVILNWYFHQYFLVADFRIKTYDRPHGNINGLLIREFNQESHPVIYLNDGVKYLDRKDGTGVAVYKTEFYFKYFDEQDDYLRILYHTSPEQEIWIKKSDLSEKFKVRNWTDFAASSGFGIVVINNYSVNVRTGPGTSFKKIYNLSTKEERTLDYNEKRTVLLPTGKTKGRWIEVKAFKKKPCSSYNAKESDKAEFTGWLKATDDTGFPNVFARYCGC